MENHRLVTISLCVIKHHAFKRACKVQKSVCKAYLVVLLDPAWLDLDVAVTILEGC